MSVALKAYKELYKTSRIIEETVFIAPERLATVYADGFYLTGVTPGDWDDVQTKPYLRRSCNHMCMLRVSDFTHYTIGIQHCSDCNDTVTLVTGIDFNKGLH